MGFLQVEDERLVDRVGGLGHEGDDVAILGEAFQSGVFAINQDHGDLAVVYGILAADDDGVAVFDTGCVHAVSNFIMKKSI